MLFFLSAMQTQSNCLKAKTLFSHRWMISFPATLLLWPGALLTFFFSFLFSSPQLPCNSMVKHYKAFDSHYCCVTVTLFWQIQRGIGCQLLSVFFFFYPPFFKVWFWFWGRSTAQELKGVSLSGEISAAWGKTPQGSFHICRVVAQGRDRAKQGGR